MLKKKSFVLKKKTRWKFFCSRQKVALLNYKRNIDVSVPDTYGREWILWDTDNARCYISNKKVIAYRKALSNIYKVSKSRFYGKTENPYIKKIKDSPLNQNQKIWLHKSERQWNLAMLLLCNRNTQDSVDTRILYRRGLVNKNWKPQTWSKFSKKIWENFSNKYEIQTNIGYKINNRDICISENSWIYSPYNYQHLRFREWSKKLLKIKKIW